MRSPWISVGPNSMVSLYEKSNLDRDTGQHYENTETHTGTWYMKTEAETGVTCIQGNGYQGFLAAIRT
jgi:hypothetical protein